MSELTAAHGDNKIVLDKTPTTCPVCLSDEITTLIYFIPYYSEEFIEKFESGEITIEQYTEEIRPEHAYWKCSCGQKFYGSAIAHDHFYRTTTDYSQGSFQVLHLSYYDGVPLVDWCGTTSSKT